MAFFESISRYLHMNQPAKPIHDRSQRGMLSRRRFLKATALAGVSTVLAACGAPAPSVPVSTQEREKPPEIDQIQALKNLLGITAGMSRDQILATLRMRAVDLKAGASKYEAIRDTSTSLLKSLSRADTLSLDTCGEPTLGTGQSIKDALYHNGTVLDTNVTLISNQPNMVIMDIAGGHLDDQTNPPDIVSQSKQVLISLFGAQPAPQSSLTLVLDEAQWASQNQNQVLQNLPQIYDQSRVQNPGATCLQDPKRVVALTINNRQVGNHIVFNMYRATAVMDAQGLSDPDRRRAYQGIIANESVHILAPDPSARQQDELLSTAVDTLCRADDAFAETYLPGIGAFAQGLVDFEKTYRAPRTSQVAGTIFRS